MLSTDFGVADQDEAARTDAAAVEVAVLEEHATVAGKHVVDTDVLGTAPEPHTDLEGESGQEKD